MVELVDDHVVERVRIEASHVLAPPERLDRREQHIRLRRPVPARVVAERCIGPDRAECAHRLLEDLLAVGDEQDALDLRPVAVERAQPGLADARGEDDETCGVSVGAGLLERRERLTLDLVRLRRRWHRLGFEPGEVQRWRSAPFVRLDPCGIDVS